MLEHSLTRPMPAPTDPPRLRRRAISDPARQALEAAGVDPVLARLFAARGVADTRDLDTGLDALLPVSALRSASSPTAAAVAPSAS